MSWTTITVPTSSHDNLFTEFQAMMTDNLAAMFPVGSYMMKHATPLGASSLIDGCWLECNGGLVAPVAYPALFGVLGTTWGGDGVTTFGLPPAGGRHLVGASGAGGHTDVNALGDQDAASYAQRSARHQHSVSESTHNHTGNAATSGGISTDHTHNSVIPGSQNSGSDVPGAIAAFTGFTWSVTSSSSPDHTHTVSPLFFSSDSGGVTVGVSGPTDAGGWICPAVLYIKAI